MNRELLLKDWPKNKWGAYVCSKEKPMPPNPIKGERWEHSDVEEIGEDYGKGGGVADGDYVREKCKNCGHTWWSELPN